ncbi:MAG TPA: hypothetical protein VF510_11465 [Ktedonobacterales bacterium]
MATIAEELSSLVAQLPPREQERVLNFARELASPPVFPHTPLPQGTPPDALLRIRVDPEVGEAMAQALAECEQIDADE